MEEKRCPVCDYEAKVTALEKTFRVNCDLCGDFNIGDAFKIPGFTEDEKIRLRYYYAKLPADDTRRVQDFIKNQNNNKL